MSLPSDRMRARYEERAERQYAAARPLPDPRLDRKFARVCELVREQLPADAFLDAPAAAAELAHVLRPGGALVLTTDNARNVVSRALNAPRTKSSASRRSAST